MRSSLIVFLCLVTGAQAQTTQEQHAALIRSKGFHCPAVLTIEDLRDTHLGISHRIGCYRPEAWGPPDYSHKAWFFKVTRNSKHEVLEVKPFY